MLFYQSKSNNFERKFYLFLHQILKESYFVVPQVHLLNLIKHINKLMTDIQWLNYCHNRSVDFIIYDKVTFYPLLAIEIQGASHNNSEAQHKDKQKKDFLQMAGIPVLYIEGKNEYTQVHKDSILSALMRIKKNG